MPFGVLESVELLLVFIMVFAALGFLVWIQRFL